MVEGVLQMPLDNVEVFLLRLAVLVIFLIGLSKVVWDTIVRIMK